MSSISAASATAVSNAQLGYEVSIAVAKKSLDAAKQEGAAALSLLQAAVDLQSQSGAKVNALGGSLDLRG